MGRDRRLGSRPRGVSRMVGQVAEDTTRQDRRPLGALQDIAADEGSASARWSIWPASTRRDGLTKAPRTTPRNLPSSPSTPSTSGPSSIRRRCRAVFCRRLSRTFAFDRGMAMGCDMAGLAVGALAVCAAAIPDGIKLQPKKHDTGWQESARLWVALVGSPSTMKTPMMAAAVKPLRRIDNEMARDNQRAMAEWLRLPKEEQRKTPRPKQPRAMMMDTTIEAAQEILKDSPNGVLLDQDELSGWFGSMDKYSGGRGAQKDRAFWLESYNGGSYTVRPHQARDCVHSITFRCRSWAASSPSRSGSLPTAAKTTGSCSA